MLARELATVRILYVDTSVNNRKIFAEHVTEQVKENHFLFNLVTARSVEDAQEFLDGIHFDLVITRYNLADGDAFDVLDYVQFKLEQINASRNSKDNIFQLKDTKVVILFSEVDERLANKAMRKGVFDYEIVKKQESLDKYASDLVDIIFRALTIYSSREKVNLVIKRANFYENNDLLTKILGQIRKGSMKEKMATRTINDVYYVDYLVCFDDWKLGPTYQKKRTKPLFQNIQYQEVLVKWYTFLGMKGKMYPGAYTQLVEDRPDLKVILFPIVVNDPKSKDKRDMGKNNCLFVLLYHCAVSECIPREKSLLRLFENHTEHIKNLEQLKNFDAWNLIEEILNEGRKEAGGGNEICNQMSYRNSTDLRIYGL